MNGHPSPRLSQRTVAVAFAGALLVDSLQLPINVALTVALVPAAVAEVILDLLAATAAIRLLGFHWLLLPSFLLELVPVLDTLPTWTGCVGFVIWKRLRAAERPVDLPPSPAPVILAKEANPREPLPVIEVVAEPVTSPAAALPDAATSPLRSAMADSLVGEALVPPPIKPTLPPPLPETSPQARVFRSREGLVIGLLVIPALLFAVWLLTGLRRPAEKPVLSQAEQVARIVVDAAQRRADAAQARCDEVRRRFEAVALPGPEPDLFPLGEYFAWRARRKAWQAAEEIYQKSWAEVHRAQQEAAAELARLKQDLANVAASTDTTRQVKGVWAGYITPVLHGLLAFSLFRFSTRAVFRFLLLKDRIGAIQI